MSNLLQLNSFTRCRLTLLGLFLLYSLLLNAQSAKVKEPYEPRFKLEMGILAGAGAGIGTAWYLRSRMEPLTSMELSDLNSANIADFDRRPTRFWNPNLTTASNISSGITMASPFLLLLDEPIRKDFRPVMIMGVETFLLTDMLGSIAKVATKRTRPYAYNKSGKVPEHIQRDRNARLSFFSKPVANASAMSFFTAKVYTDYHPNSKYKALVWTGAATLPLVTGIMRYRTGEEHPSDLIVGYLVGAGIGYLVPWIHKKRKEKASRIN